MSFMSLLLLGAYSVSATWTPRPPRIDGRLEELWFSAEPITQFTQMNPYPGEPASEPTRVYVLVDGENVYFGWVCETPGRRPELRITPRDGGAGDVSR